MKYPRSFFSPLLRCWLSHAVVTWLPWFSPIVLVRIAHCDIKLTGYVPHNCVTLTVAWTAEWCLACPGCGILYCSASEHITQSTLFGSSQGPVVVLTWFLLPGQAMMTPNMQSIIMAIGKSSSVYEKSGPEAAFFKVHSIPPIHFPIPHSLTHSSSIQLLFYVYLSSGSLQCTFVKCIDIYIYIYMNSVCI